MKMLNLPQFPRRRFKHHFLSVVHCEIGFVGTAIEKILSAESDLKVLMSDHGFLGSRRVVQGQVSMEAKEGQPPTVSHRADPIGFAYSSQVPRRDIQVLDTKIVISDQSYEGFEEFSARWLKIIRAINGIVPRTQINKVGLRKINSIVIDPVSSYEEACSIFNPTIFAQVRSGLVESESLKAHEEVTVAEKGKLLAVLRATLKKQSKPNAYEAGLDFDFVDLNLTDLEKAFEFSLPTLNQRHFDLFMWAASEDLIKTLET